MKNETKFYQQQKNVMEKDAVNPERTAIHESWFNEDTADFWRHNRLYEAVAPLAQLFKGAKWVSIGDGRYGLDSYRLGRLFGIHVFPTDIAENMFRQGMEKGLFKQYGVENAESLSFKDASFDVVFCKETLHHLPRPMIAVYEMLRVAKKAVVLIEPNDPLTFGPIKNIAKSFLKNLVLPNKNSIKQASYSLFAKLNQSFEPSGNFVYEISKREILKVALGLGLPCVAWKGMNDYYIEGCEFARAAPDDVIFQKIAKEIKNRDEKCRRFPQFFDFGLVVVLLFKEQVSPEFQEELIHNGYEIPALAHNPVI